MDQNMADEPFRPGPDSRPNPETPRSEPEILPPTRPGAPLGNGGPGAGDSTWTSYGFQRIEMRRISPLRLFIWALIALSLLVLIAGTMLIALPIIAGLAALSFGAAWLRRVLRR
jgi:hypothetical protein